MKDKVLKHNSELPLNASEQDTPSRANIKESLRRFFFVCKKLTKKLTKLLGQNLVKVVIEIYIELRYSFAIF